MFEAWPLLIPSENRGLQEGTEEDVCKNNLALDIDLVHVREIRACPLGNEVPLWCAET